MKKRREGKQLEDKDIIRLYFERDENAITKTSEKYGAYCRAISENILRNTEDSEECMNSAWLCLWNTIPPQNPRNLKVFVAKITRNIALNKIKAKNAEKRGGGEADVLIDELSECIASGENVEEKIDAKELGKIINHFAENLPERERNVFIRRYFFFESPETIGERYGISSNHVSVLLHRTRKKLRKNLEKEGYFQ